VLLADGYPPTNLIPLTPQISLAQTDSAWPPTGLVFGLAWKNSMRLSQDLAIVYVLIPTFVELSRELRPTRPYFAFLDIGVIIARLRRLL
jgi:hypothetical protein